jgi:Tol biopolymer transport system component
MRLKPAIIVLILLALPEGNGLFGQEASVYKVERLPLNSGPFSEISPVMVRDGILFCSDRRTSGIVDRTSFDNRRLYNIFIAVRKDTTDWQRPLEIKSERSSLFNSGPLCIASDGKTVYFTSEIETGEPSKSRRFRNRSGIFTGTLSGNELISIQPFKFNNPDYNLGQPSISADGRYLFFASDMPGGQGGSDIFFCESINNDWSNPVNLGPAVNSPGIENYPFIHSSGKLYFTSDRQGGIGGLDVWYTSLNNNSWDAPERLSEPVNSPSDDFAFVAQPDLQKGYFSSNRLRNDD